MGILRLLLALSVVADHVNGGIFGNHLTGGPVAVQSFYLISGFYMALVLNGKYADLNWTTFIKQRIFRLYPLYIIILMVTFGWCILPYAWKGLPPNGQLLPWYTDGGNLSTRSLVYLIASQLSLIGQDVALFLKFSGTPWTLELTADGIKQTHPVWTFMLIPQAWSISVELLFYVVAPFLVRMTVRRQLAIVAVTFAARAVLYFSLGLNFDPWTHRLIFLELGTFLAGSLAYQFYERNNERLTELSHLGVVAVVGLCLASLFYFEPGLESVKRVGFILVVFVSLPVIFARFRKAGWDLKLAELSYPLYMVHILVITVCLPSLQSRVAPSMTGAIIAGLSVASAAILYVSFVRPLERFRHRLLKNENGKGGLPK